MKPEVKIGEEFRPAPQFRRLYYTYAAPVFVFFLIFSGFMLVVVPLAGLVMLSLLLILTGFFLYWVPKYYQTMVYRLTSDEITWRRGVWFRMTGIVSYNRITNIDIIQGPVSRSLGIASLNIQTAGYSAPKARSSEIQIEGMTHFEDLRDEIMGMIRNRKPMAVETYGKDESTVLNELVKIRKLLEKPGRKK